MYTVQCIVYSVDEILQKVLLNQINHKSVLGNRMSHRIFLNSPPRLHTIFTYKLYKATIIFLLLSFALGCVLHALKMDKYRRKGKGRRCSLGDRIYFLVLFLTSYFAQGQFWRIGLIHPFLHIIQCNSSYSSNRPSLKQLAWQGN